MTSFQRIAISAAVAVAAFSVALRVAAAPAVGSLIRTNTVTTVYYVAQEGKRYSFPNEKVYASWYGKDCKAPTPPNLPSQREGRDQATPSPGPCPDFTHVRRVSDGEMAAVPLGGVVLYRPGVRLIKVESDPKVYAVGSYGKLRWVTTERLATMFYGQQWGGQVDDLPSSFFPQYEIGAPIEEFGTYNPAESRDAAPTIDAYLARIRGEDIASAEQAVARNTEAAGSQLPATSAESSPTGSAGIASSGTPRNDTGNAGGDGAPPLRHTTGLGAARDPLTPTKEPRKLPRYFVEDARCSDPLPQPMADESTVTVASTAALRAALNQSASRGGWTTVFVEDGDYVLEADGLANGFWMKGGQVTVRGKSGNRDAVVLHGVGTASHGFWIRFNDVTIADLTIRDVGAHAIQVFGERGIGRFHMRNVAIRDTGEQMFKVSYRADRPDRYADDGIIECSSFAYTKGIGPQWYVGGIDAHHSRRWIVRDNVFRGIRSPETSGGGGGRWAEHAIHFWSNSEDTLVERNIMINSDRGIGFGLLGAKSNAGHWRGVIRNNVIVHDATPGDVGIGLESARDAIVAHNTVYHAHTYPNAVEYRFLTTTGARIINNLVNKKIALRDGAIATLDGNVTGAQADWFRDVLIGDAHLARAIADIVGKATPIAEVTADADGTARGAQRDVGAYEYE